MPAFIIPYAGAAAFKPDRALVAWDGGATAARAVREALPLLGMAKTVTVVVVDDGKSKSLAGEPGADVAAYLARHGLDVTVRVIANTPKGVADAITRLCHLERRRLDGDGRLRPRSLARVHPWWRHPRHPRDDDPAGPDGALKKEARHEGGPGAETQGTGLLRKSKLAQLFEVEPRDEGRLRLRLRATRSAASARIAARRSTERIAKATRRIGTARQRHHRGDVALGKADVAQHAVVPLEEFGDRTPVAGGLPDLGEAHGDAEASGEQTLAERWGSCLKAVVTMAVSSGQ